MLTVVIPAFNAEKYIFECIKSVVSQITDKTPARVIVVVDGATDRTLEQAQLAQIGNEEKVRILTQDNAGASAARNAGARLAETEFITFLDADDTWSPDYLASIGPLLDLNPDLIEYNASFVSEEGGFLKHLKITRATEPHGGEVSKAEFLLIFKCYAWARVYRTKHVLEKPFPMGRRFEDTATTPWFYWKSKNTLGISKPLVRYRQHARSILSNPQPDDIVEISACMREALANHLSTQDNFWIEVAYKIHHFACNRITKLEASKWYSCSKITRSVIQDTPPPHFSGFVQQRFTILYVVLLRIKRLFDSR